MLENGFIKDHRSLLTWGWFREPNTAHLWEYLRLAANWEAGVFKGGRLGGQLVTSYPSVTGMTVQNVRTAIRHLKQTGKFHDAVPSGLFNHHGGELRNVPKIEADRSDPQAGNGCNRRMAGGNRQLRKAKRRQPGRRRGRHCHPTQKTMSSQDLLMSAGLAGLQGQATRKAHRQPRQPTAGISCWEAGQSRRL